MWTSFLTAIGVQLWVVQDGIHQWLQIFQSLSLQPASIPTVLSSTSAASLPSLSFHVYGFLLQFHVYCSILPPLLLPSTSSATFLLFSCPLPLYNPNLFPVSLHPCPVLPLQASSLLCSYCYARLGYPWGRISAFQSVFSPASSHTQDQTGIYPALRRAGDWAQRHNFPCLSAPLAGKKSKVKRMRAEPQFKTALGLAESLWGSVTKLPPLPLWEKEKILKRKPCSIPADPCTNIALQTGSLNF